MADDFKQICKTVENLDPVTYSDTLKAVSAKVLVELKELSDAESAATLYVNFVLCAIASDGKLTEPEFNMIRPALEAATEQEVPYEAAKKAIASIDSKAYKNDVDRLVDLIGAAAPEVKTDIVTLCLLICGVDGKVSRKERNWIKQLIERSPGGGEDPLPARSLSAPSLSHSARDSGPGLPTDRVPFFILMIAPHAVSPLVQLRSQRPSPHPHEPKTSTLLPLKPNPTASQKSVRASPTCSVPMAGHPRYTMSQDMARSTSASSAQTR